MSDKALVLNDEEFSWILDSKSKTGNDLASGDLPGQVANALETQNMMTALQNAVMDTHVGANVSRAMAQVMNNIAQNNPELMGDIIQDVERIIENAEDNEVDYLDDVDEIVRENFDLPAVVVDAVVDVENNENRDVMPVNPTWHNLVNTNRNFAESIKRLGNQVFSMFPCYEEGIQRNGQNQAEDINVLFNMKLRGNAGAFEQQAFQMAQNSFADERDLNAMASWIAKNGAVVEKTDVSFVGLTPNNYSAQMVMAVTEDKTFLLVKEDSGLAEYSFNDATGDMVIKVKEGKTIRNGDLLKVLNIDSDGDFNFLDGSGLSVIRTNDGKFGVIYDGLEPISDGFEFRTRIMNYDAVEDNLKQNIIESLGYMGDFSGNSPGVSPVDAQYIYTWSGGRRHYLENPESRQKLKILFSGNRLRRDMVMVDQIENDQIQHQIAERNIMEEVQSMEPVGNEVKPVTIPEKKESLGSNRLQHMQMLLKNKGFSKGLTSIDEFCVCKQLDSGGVCIVTSGNNKKLPITNIFNITISTDMNLENGETQNCSLDELEDKIDNILKNGVQNKI